MPPSAFHYADGPGSEGGRFEDGSQTGHHPANEAATRSAFRTDRRSFPSHTHTGSTAELTRHRTLMRFTSDESIEDRRLLVAVPIRVRRSKTASIAIETLPELCQTGDRFGIDAGPHPSMRIDSPIIAARSICSATMETWRCDPFTVYPFHRIDRCALSEPQRAELRLRASARDMYNQVYDHFPPAWWARTNPTQRLPDLERDSHVGTNLKVTVARVGHVRHQVIACV
jgi:hypothetical protein